MKKITNYLSKSLLFIVFTLFQGYSSLAQSNGISALTGSLSTARTDLEKLWKSGLTVVQIICGIVGLIALVQVYQKMTGGDPAGAKNAGAWFAGLVALFILSAVLKSAIGIN